MTDCRFIGAQRFFVLVSEIASGRTCSHDKEITKEYTAYSEEVTVFLKTHLLILVFKKKNLSGEMTKEDSS